MATERLAQTTGTNKTKERRTALDAHRPSHGGCCVIRACWAVSCVDGLAGRFQRPAPKGSIRRVDNRCLQSHRTTPPRNRDSRGAYTGWIVSRPRLWVSLVPRSEPFFLIEPYSRGLPFASETTYFPPHALDCDRCSPKRKQQQT